MMMCEPQTVTGIIIFTLIIFNLIILSMKRKGLLDEYMWFLDKIDSFLGWFGLSFAADKKKKK